LYYFTKLLLSTDALSGCVTWTQLLRHPVSNKLLAMLFKLAVWIYPPLFELSLVG
jgi:hypothetical protein